MDSNSTAQLDVAPFRTVEFRERAEFEEYSKASEGLRGDRWLYEQSLATLEDAVRLPGTCGLCLTETVFTASTRGGESAAGGRVPNWREELVCDCRQRLSNRHRAVMHYLLAAELLHPWTRVLGLGDLGALLPLIKSHAQHLSCWSGAIDELPAKKAAPDRGHHLVISMEQLHAGCVRPDVLSALASQLLDGGRLIFTTPFDVNSDGSNPDSSVGPIGWAMLPSLRQHGFSDAKACMYWSEEFGYLGPFNFIFEASK
jgi:hypothetical protein